jgi:uncharacterized membrane protein YeaQ/YmgE (transglycosylase-associated protein family)
MHFLWFILVGLVAGWLTGKIMKGSGYGVIGDIVIGILGALFGGWIAGHLGFIPTGTISEIIVAVLGAIILTLLYRLITGSRS